MKRAMNSISAREYASGSAWGPDLMKRRLFTLVAAASLLLSLAAAAAWAVSYARPCDWRLLGMAHSADLARVDLGRRTAVLITPTRIY